MTTSVTISRTVRKAAHLRASHRRVRRLAAATVATAAETTPATTAATAPAPVTATNGTVSWNSYRDLDIESIWMTGSVSAVGDLRIVLDGKTVVDAFAADIFSGSLGAPFIFPLVANNSQSRGEYYIDVPMTFTSSMQVSTGADPGYYDVDYRTLPTATGTFTLQVNPSNRGVVLQRTSDQDAAGQSADVSVDDTDLGTWLEPLANPNHRWLDGQFEVPTSVSAGQLSITVRVSPAAGSPWLAAGYETLSILPGRVRAVRDGGLHPGRAPRRRTHGSLRGHVRRLHPEQI
jgi:hypothetical protein